MDDNGLQCQWDLVVIGGIEFEYQDCSFMLSFFFQETMLSFNLKNLVIARTKFREWQERKKGKRSRMRGKKEKEKKFRLVILVEFKY